MLPRLLHVTPYYLPDFEFGGPVRIVSEISEVLHPAFDVTVYTYRFSNRPFEDSPHVSVKRFRPLSRWMGRRFNAYASPALNREVKRTIRQFDIVHTHDYRSFHNIALAKHCAKNNIPLIMSTYQSVNPLTGQSHLKKIFDHLFGKHLLTSVQHFIAVNVFEGEELRRIGVPSERISIIPNCIANENVQSTPGEFRKRYGIPPEKKVVLFFSRLDPLKRPDIVIDAFAELHKQNVNTFLVLCGPTQNQTYLHSLEKRIAQLGIKADTLVIPHTVREGRHAIYNDSDLLALPSPYHEFPLVLLEAMAHGLPIVTAERSIEKEIHEQCGLVTSPTPHDFSRAFASLLDHPETHEKFRTRAPLIFQENFTIQKYVERVSSLYARYLPPYSSEDAQSIFNPSSNVV